MQICQVESCPPNRRRTSIWTSHPRKCLGSCPICSHLPRKRSCSNCWTRNLVWRISLCWILSKNYRKGIDCRFQRFAKEQHLVGRLSFETKHDHLRINPRKEEREQLERRINQNCQSPFKISSPSFGWNYILVRRTNWRRSFPPLELHEPSQRHQKTMVLEFLIR